MHLTLVAEPVTAPPRVSALAPPEDYTFFKISMMTGMAMVAVLVAFAISPGDVRNDSEDIIGDVIRVIRPDLIKTVDVRKQIAASDAARARG